MSTIYLSETADIQLIRYLQDQGHMLNIIKDTGVTYAPVASHPDIYLCSLGPGKPVFFGCPEKLGHSYPHNIRYNAAATGKWFIHNLHYTDPLLLKAASNMEKIHVSQGYTKCNIVIVDETSIITSDCGIYQACKDKLNVLLIRPGYVNLRNFSYGFLGGSSGRIGNSLVFNGDLSRHPDFKKIAAFVEDRNINIIYFKDYPLEDIGSILEIQDPSVG